MISLQRKTKNNYVWQTNSEPLFSVNCFPVSDLFILWKIDLNCQAHLAPTSVVLAKTTQQVLQWFSQPHYRLVTVTGSQPVFVSAGADKGAGMVHTPDATRRCHRTEGCQVLQPRQSHPLTQHVSRQPSGRSFLVGPLWWVHSGGSFQIGPFLLRPFW